MNPVPFSWMLIAFGIIFASGNVTGAWFVHELWTTGAWKAAYEREVQENNRFREQLGFSHRVDDESRKIEVTNEEILLAIAQSAPERQVVVPRDRWWRKVVKVPAECPAPVECVSARSMRQIGTLK